MSLTVSTTSPSECIAAELAEVASLVRAGGEVMEAGVERRIREAKALFLVRDGEGLVAVAALKNPRPTYRRSVFRKAAAEKDPKLFRHELGWVFVLPRSRGNGLSHALVNAAVANSMGTPIFATCRVDTWQCTGHSLLLDSEGMVQNTSPSAAHTGWHCSFASRDVRDNLHDHSAGEEAASEFSGDSFPIRFCRALSA